MAERLFDLSRIIAVVIGGTGVLGGTLAEVVASAGAAVAIAGRNREGGRLDAGRFAARERRLNFRG